ncbi:unnamed protein product [Orchesella dallaii]|uniref:F-box domain-containing protein n=1 Tax=Orchesella dallaii TaxID=48710 RepID=A0ABP1QQB2_9HEXA
MASLDLLPNELLCNILGMLSTKEKLRAREVCRRWKGVVDEFVPFYRVQLCDKTFDEVAMRFGSRRVSSLEFTCEHSDSYNTHSIIPIQNLSFLKRLVLAQDMRVDALADVAMRADNLIELDIRYGHIKTWHEKKQIAALLPALREIKKLLLPILCQLNRNPISLFNLWKDIMQREMPKLQHLEIDVCTGNPTSPHFIDLATFKPHLREFVVQKADALGGRVPNKRVTLVWNVNGQSRDSEGLRKLKLINEASCVLKDETPQWETLLSNQSNMEELQLYDFYVQLPGKEGYSMSLIEPVLTRSMKTLHTIRLDIGAERVGTCDDFDMEIFSKLATLRELHLSVRVVKFRAIFGKGINFLRGIKNCSTVISATLCKLVLHGFRFTTEEVNDCIKEIAKLDLKKVDFYCSRMPEISTVWEEFSSQARKMGLKNDVQTNSLYLPAEFIGVEFYFEHRKS